MEKKIVMYKDLNPIMAVRKRLKQEVLANISFTGYKVKEQRLCAISILTNSLVGYIYNKELGLSRNKNGNTKVKSAFTPEMRIKVVDILVEGGYLTQEKGYYDWRDVPKCLRNKTRVTTLKPSLELLVLFNNIISNELTYVDGNSRLKYLSPVRGGKTKVVKGSVERVLTTVVIDQLIQIQYTYTTHNYTIRGIREEKQVYHTNIIEEKPIYFSLPTSNKYLLPYTITPIKDSIQLRDKNKERVSIINKFDKEDMKRMKTNLDKYNKLASEQVVFGPVDGKMVQLDVCSRRIFSNNSPYEGGRFYGGGHISHVRRQDRKGIIINGEPTVELDYSALHPRFLYNLKGLILKGDPYQIYEDQSDELRTIIKVSILCGINADNEHKAIQGAREELLKLNESGKITIDPELFTYDKIKQYLQLLIEKHHQIADAFFSGIGIKLQNIDSMIAEDVLAHFTNKGILALSVHDSFIVPKPYREELFEVMTRVYERRLGFRPLIH